MRVLAIAVSIMVNTGVLAQTKPACEVDNPPSNCQNMWSVTVDIAAPNGAYAHVSNPTCMNDAAGEVAKMHELAIKMANPKLAIFAGPISKITGTAVADYFRNNGGGDFGRLFSPYSTAAAMCVPVGAIIPVNSTYKGFRLLAAEVGAPHQGCPSNGQDCAIGWSRYLSPPVLTSDSSVKTVHTMFANWSHDRQRQARMIVFFEMPAGAEIGVEL